MVRPNNSGPVVVVVVAGLHRPELMVVVEGRHKLEPAAMRLPDKYRCPEQLEIHQDTIPTLEASSPSGGQ